MNSTLTRWDKLSRLGGAYFSYVLFLCLGLGLSLGGWWYLSGFIFVSVIVPLLDMFSSPDLDNFRKNDFGPIETQLLRLAPVGFVIGYLFFLYRYLFAFDQLNAWEVCAALASLGMTGAIAFTACHELMHKRGSPLRLAVSRAFLLHMCYLHYEQSHVFGHHTYVGLKRDNNTAWMNESALSYVLRTIPGTFLFTWNYSKLRQSTETRISPMNTAYLQLAVTGIFLVTMVSIFGFAIFLFLLAQSAVAVIVMELISYIEHYGLMRSKVDGGIEQVRVVHSWDSYHRFSNYLTFMVQRHADHHTCASRDYYLLSANEESPQLPFGYPVMTTIALVPFVWRWLMERELTQWASTHSESRLA